MIIEMNGLVKERFPKGCFGVRPTLLNRFPISDQKNVIFPSLGPHLTHNSIPYFRPTKELLQIA